MSTTTRITTARYDEMVRRGEFEPREEHHVELIHGEISPMSPVGPPHHRIVCALNEWSFKALPSEAVLVSVQGPVGIPALDSEPEPDLVWALRNDYATRHPRPEEILLVVEVSDSSLARDRGVKAELYAEAGIADYWVVNIPGRCVEVRRQPQGKTYRSVEVFGAGQEVRPLAFPGVALAVDHVFPS